MKVFVTGATGFVGRALVGQLRSDGHGVTALLLPRESADGLEGVDVVRGDITDPASLAGVVAGHAAVVHLAGAVAYGQALDHCRRINVVGTENVANEAVRAGVSRFLHMSSVSVYGRVAHAPITEDSPLRRTGDPYGDTKIDAELVVRRIAERAGMALTVVRPTGMYGPGDQLYMPRIVDNLRAGRARLIGDGRHMIDGVHVADAARFLSGLLTDPRAAGQTINIADPDNPSWRELMTVVAEELGVAAPKPTPYAVMMAVAGGMELASRVTGKPPLLTRYAVKVAGRPYRYVTTRARALGFRTTRAMEDGVREWLREGGP